MAHIEIRDGDGAEKHLKATGAGAIGDPFIPEHTVGTAPATAAEGGALPSVFSVVAGDDGTDAHPLQVDGSGSLKAVLQTGAAAIGKLAANNGVDIGDVDVTSISAGENHIGQVGSEGTTIALTPAVTAGVYTAGDAVGGLLTFADAARVSGGGGVIKNIIIIDDAGQDAELELWLFDRAITAMSDNAPWAPSEADLENFIGAISTEDSTQGWLAAGTPSAIDVEVSRRYDLNGTSLFGQLVTRGTPTFAATDDVTLKVGLLQD